MQKLLIVLAIPVDVVWALSNSAVTMQMACLGCAVGLLWPLWSLMLLTCLLVAGYLAFWLGEFLSLYYDEDVTDVNFTALYFEFHLKELLLALAAAIPLVFRANPTHHGINSVPAAYHYLGLDLSCCTLTV